MDATDVVESPSLNRACHDAHNDLFGLGEVGFAIETHRRRWLESGSHGIPRIRNAMNARSLWWWRGRLTAFSRILTEACVP